MTTPHEATTQPLLWDDDKIHQELGVKTDSMLDYASSFIVGLDVALRVGKLMRDEYEAELARLRAELADVRGRWQRLIDAIDATEGAWDDLEGALSGEEDDENE